MAGLDEHRAFGDLNVARSETHGAHFSRSAAVRTEESVCHHDIVRFSEKGNRPWFDPKGDMCNKRLILCHFRAIAGRGLFGNGKEFLIRGEEEGVSLAM